jgi:hypothetical protein
MSPTVVQIEGILGLFLVLLGAMWLVMWGETYGAIETAASFLAGAVACSLAYRSSYRVGGGGGGRRWRAVWCRIARWANTPPEWRVEDTYVGGFVPPRVDGHGSGACEGRSKKL